VAEATKAPDEYETTVADDCEKPVVAAEIAP
jgi:hypothetical protein